MNGTLLLPPPPPPPQSLSHSHALNPMEMEEGHGEWAPTFQ